MMRVFTFPFSLEAKIQLTKSTTFFGVWSCFPQDRSSVESVRRMVHNTMGNRATRKSAVCLSCTNTPIVYCDVTMGKIYMTRSLPVGQILPVGSITFTRSLGGRIS